MQSRPREYRIERKRKLFIFGRRWKVQKIYVRPGGEVTLSSTTSFDVWFPPGRNPLLNGVPMDSKQNKVTLKIKPDAQPGEYEYSIFCYDDNKMAVGKSSPRMEIGEKG
jgi:hypothetical protein